MDLAIQAIIALRLFLAFVMGAILGYERGFQQKPAGSRTHALVCLGSALFMIISLYGFLDFPGQKDPARVAAQVVTGMGFIGAGAIWREGSWVKGLTTAATLWVSSSLGLAVGVGLYLPAIVSLVLAYLTLEFYQVKKIFTGRDERVEGQQLIEDFKLGFLRAGLEGILAQPVRLHILNLANPYIFSFDAGRNPHDPFTFTLSVKGDTLNIVLIYLPENLRGQSYTRKIFNLVLNWATQTGFKRITLTSKEEVNALWLKLGFQPVSESTFVYQIEGGKYFFSQEKRASQASR